MIVKKDCVWVFLLSGGMCSPYIVRLAQANDIFITTFESHCSLCYDYANGRTLHVYFSFGFAVGLLIIHSVHMRRS